MKIYFVRHGLTAAWENNFHQPNHEPLGATGRSQAQKLAKRFAHTPLDLIISSPRTRTLETAQAIGQKILVSDLFKEVTKPTEIIGQSRDSKEAKDILRKIGEMYAVDSTWHYSDEENFEDLKSRGLAALEFLRSQKVENVLVVSHANFIALIVCLMLFDKNLTVEVSLRFKNFLRLGNTGVSVCTFEDNNWRLQCWNDTSHLLE